MTGAIYLLQGKQLIEMNEQPNDSEQLLQSLLADYPRLLAGDQVDEENPRRWLLVDREIGIPWEKGGGNQMSLITFFWIRMEFLHWSR
jgi:hypothetical protein